MGRDSQSMPCPACGSSEHDGWTNRDGCPEDWSTVQRDSFEHRRRLQLANEQVIAEAQSRAQFDLVWQCTCGRASRKDQDQGEWFHSDDDTPVCVERLEVAALVDAAPDGDTFTYAEMRIALTAFALWAGVVGGVEAVDRFLEETL